MRGCRLCFGEAVYDPEMHTMKCRSNSFAIQSLALLSSLALSSAFVGCGLGGDSAIKSPSGAPAITSFLRGGLHGGQQPIVGAKIQIFVAGVNTPGPGVTGYGTGATALGTAVTTDGSGVFNIPAGNYVCPTPSQQAYLIASGGNTGAGLNYNVALMAALGTCPAGGNLIATVPFINVDEVTTVAAVWSLQQFMAAPGPANSLVPNIGAPDTAYSNGLSGVNAFSVQSAVVGLNNAFVTASVLADVATGLSPNKNYPYATPENAKINTIADILAPCVNSVSVSPTTASALCTSLFNAATPSGQPLATDTIQAAWYMAQNPINNLTNLYSLIGGSPPFQPVYTAPGTLSGSAPSVSAFNDATIAVNYAPTAASAYALGKPYGIAIDAFGNAWMSNTGFTTTTGTAQTIPASVTELGVDGSVLVPPVTTFTASATGGTASQFTTLPTLARTVSNPKSVAVDLTNRAWVSNFGDTATGAQGTLASPTTATTSEVAVLPGSLTSGTSGVGGAATAANASGYFVGVGPWGLAIDGADNVYVANSNPPATGEIGTRSIGRLSGIDGSGYIGSTTTPYIYNPPNAIPGGPTFIAIDTNPNVTGGILWSSSQQACQVAGTGEPTPGQGVFYVPGSAKTEYGALNMYASTLASLSGSSAVTSYSGAVLGSGGTTNCGTASDYVGQLYSAPTANTGAIAVDRNNGVWITDETFLGSSQSGFDGLTYLSAPVSSNGVIPSSTTLVNGVAPSTSAIGTPGTTLATPIGPAVDGNNNVWVGNTNNRAIVEASYNNGTITLLTPGQGSAYGSTGAASGLGFVHAGAGTVTLAAVDPSGNIWFTNQNSSSTYTDQNSKSVNVSVSTIVLVGAGGPVITPLSLAVKYKALGTKP